MNPVDLARGRSFKGLASYLLHDASEDEGEHQASAERVGWTQSHNLNDASADKAWRLMVATSKSADALKKAAGETNVGAKNTKPVYHYVITWPAADQPSEQLQKQAVAESLKTLKLDEHQALAVQHLDGQAPHVHVMVNLINPENGTTPKLSYTKRNLRKWANEFELKHGLQVTQGSAANAVKRTNGEAVDARRKSRNVYEQEQREGKDRRTAWLRDRSSRVAQDLQRQNKALQARHTAEWAKIKGGYYARRDGLYAAEKDDVAKAITQVKDHFKPKWAAVYQNNRERLKQFEQSERSAFMQIFTATTTFLQARREGKNVLRSLDSAMSATARRELIERWNRQDKDKLKKEVNQEISSAVQLIREGADIKISGNRTAFLDQCGELKHQQQAARSVQREKWREYSVNRRSGFAKVTGQKLDQGRALQQDSGLRQALGRKLEP